jgi:hypothetical protein
MPEQTLKPQECNQVQQESKVAASEQDHDTNKPVYEHDSYTPVYSFFSNFNRR